MELRKLRKAREGIDAAKLNKGVARKKKKRVREEKGGLRKGAHDEEEEWAIHSFLSFCADIRHFISFSDEEGKEARTRRVIRSNNFTQQTNTLDVDKHMCAISIYRIMY